MGKSIKDILSSYRTSIVLLLIYATALALATVIEKYGGTPVAKAFVYYSPALFLLYGLIMVNFFATSVRHNLFKSRKWGFLVTHLSFVVILAGALVTHLFGQEGVVHLREGESTGSMLVQTNRGTSMHQLPFSLELVKFTLVRYPGSSSPSSFESDLIIHVDGEVHKEKISMNNVIDLKGYRLFQASYDKDERGSILSVNKDVAGRSITYTGYVLLFVGLILCFTGKNTRFRVLAKQLLSVGCVLLFMLPVNTHARPPEPSPAHAQISREHAKSFGSLPMQSVRGRIQPVNTFSSEVLRKLHKSGKINGLNPDQFLLSVLCLPEMWMQTPLISCDNKSITYNHDLADGYCSYNEMFDSNGRYKLEAELTEAFAKPPASRTGYEKDLIKLDEQVNIVHLLFGWGLINLFPVKGDEQHTWYAPGDNFPENAQVAAAEIREIMSDYRYAVVEATQSHNWQQADKELQRIRDWQNSNNTLSEVSPGRIKAELAYNNVNIFSFCRKIYLIMGATLLFIAFGTLFSTHRRLRWLTKVLIIHLIVVMCLHLAGILVRWYIAGYAPWSNSYETMVLLSFLCILAGMLFARHNIIPLALSTLLAGVILFVSGLNWMNPQITPLVPVLKSPWLMIHVALIMVSYGFFGISCLLGLTNLILMKIKNAPSVVSIRIRELTIINEMSLLTGLAFLCAGVFVGAIWANESWGRYWGWDPKETWALITIIVYVMVTHLRLVKKWDNPFLFNLISVLAFASVLMTYFGVNYLLSGMHSYN